MLINDIKAVICDIHYRVADRFVVDRRAMFTTNRQHYLVRAKAAAAFISKRITGSSRNTMGAMFGMNGSVFDYRIKCCIDLMDTDTQYKEVVESELRKAHDYYFPSSLQQACHSSAVPPPTMTNSLAGTSQPTGWQTVDLL